MQVEPSFWEEQGHLRMAVALLSDCVKQIADDPQRTKSSTREELAWLKGELEGSPVTAEHVFLSLGLSDWGDKFIDLAERDPSKLVDSLKGIDHILKDLSEGGSNRSYALEDRIDHYRESARSN